MTMKRVRLSMVLMTFMFVCVALSSHLNAYCSDTTSCPCYFPLQATLQDSSFNYLPTYVDGYGTLDGSPSYADCWNAMDVNVPYAAVNACNNSSYNPYYAEGQGFNYYYGIYEGEDDTVQHTCCFWANVRC
jgi:hypothetical protein